MRKLFSCILVATMLVAMFSFCYAKTFSDVKNTKYDSSVTFLNTLGIVDGYQDGTFKPNNTVTRAELAKLIIVSLGKEKTADSLKGQTTYSDVASSSWASGYINCANSLAIIKGYPDGTFKPNNPVTYVEASTMLLRALNYTRELENEKYPTGYMSKANEAGILDDVVAKSSTENAIRGNIAIMIVNTLKGNVRKIVSTNSNGTATYGPGTPLIEQNFKDYKAVKDGEVLDIDFDNKEITVRDKTNSRKVRAYINKEAKLEELYLRTVEFIYDDKEDVFITFKITDDYKVEEVDVKEIDEESLVDDDKEEYDIPEDVLMVYVSNYDEVETAYIIYDGKKIIGMVLTGTPEIFAGVVTETGLTVSKRKGFEIVDIDGKYKELALSDTSKKLAEDEVVLYSLDNDKYAVIHEDIALKNATGIEEVTTSSIKLKKESKISLSSEIEHYVYLVDTEGYIREGKLKDIDEEFDMAYIYQLSDVYYIVIFEDSVDDDDIVSKLSVSEAKEELEEAIKTANKYLKKESSYSVDTFESLREAVDAGNAALKTSSSAAKLELAARKINEARESLKSATSSDKQLRSDYEDLQAIIKEAEAKKSSDYTASSYKGLTDELKNAKAVKLSNTTSAKISDRITALRKAINLLVTNTANNEIQAAIKNLNSLITKGDNIVKNKADYTDTSYNKFSSALSTAKAFKSSSASLAEIKNQASNLEAAIDQLEPKLLATYKSKRSTLDSTYVDALNRVKSNYTKESYELFEEEFDDLKAEYKELKSISEVESLPNAEIEGQIKAVEGLTSNIKKALGKLVTVTDDTTRANLKKLIAKGETYTKETWNNSTLTFEKLQEKLTNAKKIANNASSTETEVMNAFTDLIKYISL